MSEIFQARGADGIVGVPAAASLSLATAGIEWQPCGSDGFWIKPLLEDPARGLRSWLMRVDPGAYSPPHAHDEVEQLYLLEGSFYDQDRRYGPGDYIVRDAGAEHSAGSDDGALMLLFYSPASAL